MDISQCHFIYWFDCSLGLRWCCQIADPGFREVSLSALHCIGYSLIVNFLHTGQQKAIRVSTSHHVSLHVCMSMGFMTRYAPIGLPVVTYKYLNFGSHQILGFTTDNASNNNTLVDKLTELIDGFQGPLTLVRCFTHILNLVVKVRRLAFII
jgi:hypothetical protein